MKNTLIEIHTEIKQECVLRTENIITKYVVNK